MPQPLTAVGVIGLGRTGKAVAGALLSAGHRVTVWDPNWQSALPLAASARVAGSALEVCELSRAVAVCLSDRPLQGELLFSEAAQRVLRRKLVLQLNPRTVGDALHWQRWAVAAGFAHLEGAVAGLPSSIGRPETLAVYSGSARAFQQWRELLRAISPLPVYLGAEAGATVELSRAISTPAVLAARARARRFPTSSLPKIRVR